MKLKSKISAWGVLFWLHLWIGLVLCIPLILIGLTGTILVFQRNIDQAGYHAGSGPAQPVAVIIDAARKAAPAGQQPTLFVPAFQPGEAATVRFGAAGVRGGGGGQGFGAQVAIDPASLDILGVRTGPDGFMRQVHMLHANLLIGGRDGRSVIGWLGVMMLAMGLSGLYLWWPRPGRWRAAFTVRWTARGVRLHRELHGAVGIWGLAVFIIVSFTGVDLAFPETVASAVGLVLPGADVRPAQAPKAIPRPDSTPIDIDRSIGMAIYAVPGASLRSIGLPPRPDQPYRIGLAHEGSAIGSPVITVFIDPWAARVAEIRDPALYTPGLRLIAWQRALHSGDGLGPVWRILVALCGFLPALFAITGISMWLLKRGARQKTLSARTMSLEAAE